MNGTLTLGSYRYLSDFNLDEYDIKLHITISIKQGIGAGFIHTPELAPSEDLYNKTMYKWMKLKFTKDEKEEMFKGKTQTWWDLYEIRFIKRVTVKPKFINYLNRIRQRLTEGKNILLVCYCEDYKRCHRKIIGEILEKEGFKVIFK